MRRRVAIEGPCCSGKTALAAELALHSQSPVCVLPEYVDFADGNDAVPSASKKPTIDEITDFNFFLELDQRRFSTIPPTAQLILMDRSVHTPRTSLCDGCAEWDDLLSCLRGSCAGS